MFGTIFGHQFSNDNGRVKRALRNMQTSLKEHEYIMFSSNRLGYSEWPKGCEHKCIPTGVYEIVQQKTKGKKLFFILQLMGLEEKFIEVDRDKLLESSDWLKMHG